MKRRSSSGSERGKSRGREARASKRRNATKATRDRGGSIAGQETVVAQLARERDEALEQQAATTDVLRIVGASSGNVKPVFEAILNKAVRIWRGQVRHAYSL